MRMGTFGVHVYMWVARAHLLGAGTFGGHGYIWCAWVHVGCTGTFGGHMYIWWARLVATGTFAICGIDGACVPWVHVHSVDTRSFDSFGSFGSDGADAFRQSVNKNLLIESLSEDSNGSGEFADF